MEKEKTAYEKLMELVEEQKGTVKVRTATATATATKVRTATKRTATMINSLREEVESRSSSNTYVVTYDNTRQEQWQCSCMGWTRHYPRNDCKHIREIKDELIAKGKKWE